MFSGVATLWLDGAVHLGPQGYGALARKLRSNWTLENFPPFSIFTVCAYLIFLIDKI